MHGPYNLNENLKSAWFEMYNGLSMGSFMGPKYEFCTWLILLSGLGPLVKFEDP